VSEDDTVIDLGAIRIRRKRMTDIPDDFVWRRDPELTRYDGVVPITVSYPEFANIAEHEVRHGASDRATFAIDTAGGRHAGNIMFYNVNGSRDEAEVGISLALPEVRDRGYGPAAMAAFVRYLWATTPFRVLRLRTLAWNERARAAFGRAGFSEAGTETRDGKEYVVMEARREWWLLWESEGRFEGVLARAKLPEPETAAG
jgi:RimJ/RimL family protein N-acetyltransferase